jgi:pSer/pThr/pTyr-binding forkhead associated (FHA) protein
LYGQLQLHHPQRLELPLPPRRTLIIGRSVDSDIVIDHESIARFHAELVEAGDGRYYLTDRASAAGTWRNEAGQWVKVRQCFIHPTETLLFGKHETRLVDLLGKQG